MNPFWKSFLENHYEKLPCVFSLADAGVTGFTEADGIEILQKTFSPCVVNGYKRIADRCHMNGTVLTGNHPEYLVPGTGEGFAEFIARIFDQTTALEDATFVAHQWHLHADHLYERVKRFVQPIIEHTGIPAAMYGTDFFAGKYRSTPHGIHKDTAGVFIFPVHGKKTMLVWPFDTFPPPAPNAWFENAQINGNYAEHLQSAMVLEAEPGQVIYFPQSWWHIAVNEESAPTMTLNISAHIYSRVADFARPLLEHRLNGAAGQEFIGHLPALDPKRLKNIQDIQLPSQLSALVQGIESDLKLHYLQKLSRSGLTLSPAQLRPAGSFNANATCFGDPAFPLYFVKTTDTASVLIANGTVLKVAVSPILMGLIENIQHCREFFLTDLGSHQQVADLLPLAEKLYSIGVLRQVCPDTP